MKQFDRYIALGWVMLLLVGSTITFSTLHSHHDVEWNHATTHTSSDQCLTENSNVCPICGYLFNANVAEQQSHSRSDSISALVANLSDSQLLDPFSGFLTGRSPPAV